MKLTRIAIATIIASTAIASHAADQADVRVTASVVNNCKILSTNDINFGALDPAVANDRSAQGSISFVCTKNVDYALTADQGSNFDAASSRRQMKGGNEFLPYALAQASFSGKGAGFGNPLSVTLAAAIAGADYRNLPAADYVDVLRVTLTP